MKVEQNEQYQPILKKRYEDLGFEVRMLIEQRYKVDMRKDKRLQERRLIRMIAKLTGWIKEIED